MAMVEYLVLKLYVCRRKLSKSKNVSVCGMLLLVEENDNNLSIGMFDAKNAKQGFAKNQHVVKLDNINQT